MLRNILKIFRKVVSYMQFNKNSGCVKVWITLIMNGTYTYDQVPPLLNLREQVKLVLIDMGVMKADSQPATATATATEPTGATATETTGSATGTENVEANN